MEDINIQPVSTLFTRICPDKFLSMWLTWLKGIGKFSDDLTQVIRPEVLQWSRLCHPIQPSAVIEIPCICTIQHSDKQLYVATEHLECALCYWGNELVYLILINLHFKSHVSNGYCTRCCKSSEELKGKVKGDVKFILIFWIYRSCS